jgi:hypothetical protein
MSASHPGNLYPDQLYFRFRDAEVAFSCDRLSLMRGLERHLRAMRSFEPWPDVASRDRFRIELLLDRRLSIVDCADDRAVGIESEDLDFIFWQLKDEIVLRLMKRTSDLCWVHAGGAILHGADGGPTAFLVTGAPGAGKSTLSTALAKRGCRFLGDDLLPLDLREGAWLAHPFAQTAHVRRPSEASVPAQRLGHLAKDHHDMERHELADAPARIGAILLAEYQPGASPVISDLPPSIAVLKLIDQCHNFPDYRANAFADFCRLVERVPVARLVHGGAHEAVDHVASWGAEQCARATTTATATA